MAHVRDKGGVDWQLSAIKRKQKGWRGRLRPRRMVIRRVPRAPGRNQRPAPRAPPSAPRTPEPAPDSGPEGLLTPGTRLTYSGAARSTACLTSFRALDLPHH